MRSRTSSRMSMMIICGIGGGSRSHVERSFRQTTDSVSDRQSSARVPSNPPDVKPCGMLCAWNSLSASRLCPGRLGSMRQRWPGVNLGFPPSSDGAAGVTTSRRNSVNGSRALRRAAEWAANGICDATITSCGCRTSRLGRSTSCGRAPRADLRNSVGSCTRLIKRAVAWTILRD